jgi:Raf kinase inhibitor-like YbhB/YbcL family protein
MQLTSHAISAQTPIPLTYAEQGAGGDNVIPDLSWSGAPEGTKSFAITIFDPDAPTGSGWWHWVMIDIPASVTSIPEGGPAPAGAREWINDYGYVGYGGPNPPGGPAHHYIHTVYALPVERLSVPDGAPSAAARFMVLAAAIDSASITSTFARLS